MVMVRVNGQDKDRVRVLGSPLFLLYVSPLVALNWTPAIHNLPYFWSARHFLWLQAFEFGVKVEGL
jgi:hypothetical protein